MSGSVFPAVVYNPPAQPTIRYRWGDYTAFRAALLQPAAPPLPAETELTQPGGAQVWRPTANSGDLALQIAEWWAYLADILTLYTERAANQSYIRTADLPESLPRLVPLLGYRPRPAIGAQLTLGAIVRGPRPVTLPQGLQVQSKPGPGQQPQIFELNAQAVIQPVPPAASVPPTTLMPALTAGQTTGQVLLARPPGSLKVGDEVLLVGSAWNGTDATYAVCSVTAITAATGGTSVAFNITTLGGGTGIPGAANWRFLKAASFSPLYAYLQSPYSAYQNPTDILQTIQDVSGTFVANAVAAGREIRAARDIVAPSDPVGGQQTILQPVLNLLTTSSVHLASIVRSIAPGDVILIENPAAGAQQAPVPGSVTSVTEVIYNASNPTAPTTWPPAGSPPAEPAVPMPHTLVSFNSPATMTGDAATLIVRYGYASVGTLVDPPVTGQTQIGSVTPDPASAGFGTLATGSVLLVADANGDGAAGTLSAAGAVTLDLGSPALVPPLQVFSNLLAFSRGKTIARESLGDGNPAIAGQDFTLRNTPVTYLAAAPGQSGPGYSSTVTLWVNNIQWTEVPNFYGQGPTAQVFVTQEDSQGNTHVLGGDGINGARFPSGNGNIVASYRIGAGAALPPPTSVSVLLQPQPGLSAVVNPVPPYGGQDADAPADLKQKAPASVLTFGRAVSVDDFAAVAAASPGVTRVSAGYAFDAIQQRPTVTLWVGNGPGAVAAAQAAIGPISDPNRPIAIYPANAVAIRLVLTYVRDPRYFDAPVKAALQTALADPDTGLFGANTVQIGQSFYDSQIYAACLAVPGVQAVHTLQVTVGTPRLLRYFWQQGPVWFRGAPVNVGAAGGCTGHRHSPGADGYFVLATPQLNGSVGL